MSAKTKPVKTSVPGVYKRGDGYVYVIRVDGRQRWVSGFDTLKAARNARNAALTTVEQGADVAPDRVTVGEYLAEWLDGLAHLKPSTAHSYRSKVEAYVLPRIGDVRLQRLTTQQLNAMYADLHARGGHNDKPLSDRSVTYAHAILRKAFGDAVKTNRLARNPAEHTTRPKRHEPRAEMQAYDSEQVNRLTAALEGHRLRGAIILAVTTGLRRGEIAGLRWVDVDLDDRRLRIRETVGVVGNEAQRSTPKTKGSVREFGIGPTTVEALRTHRAQQNADRLAWGAAWRNPDDRVFTLESGEPVHPNRLSEEFRAVAKAAGLPVIRFHDLRHTYATLALQARVPIEVVSKRLGHAEVAITFDCYRHVLPAEDTAAVDAFEAHVFGAVN